MRHRLVVVGLPTSDKGDEALDDLLRARRADDLLIVVQTPPRARVPLLLPMGVDGLRQQRLADLDDDAPGGDRRRASTSR